MEQTNEKKIKNKELWRTIKFTLFSISAGAIQLGVSLLLENVTKFDTATIYFIALICSVIWNFTFNRKFTFQSANNVPIAMLKVLAYYAVFTPISLFLVAWLSDGMIFGKMVVENHLNWNGTLTILINMVLNFVTEFLFDRFVVFRDSIDTNDIADRERQKEKENAEKEAE